MTVARTLTPVKRFDVSARHMMRYLIAVEAAAIRIGNLDEHGRPIVNPRQSVIAAAIGVSARQVRNIRAACCAAGWITVQATGRALRWFIQVPRFLFGRGRCRAVSARAPRPIESARASDSRNHGEQNPNGPERPMGSSRLSVTRADLSDPRRLREIAETASRNIGRHGRLVAPGRDGLFQVCTMAAHALHNRGIRDAVRVFCAMLWHREKRRTITCADEDRAKAVLAAMDRERYPREMPVVVVPKPQTPEENDAEIVHRMVFTATNGRRPMSRSVALINIRAVVTAHGWTLERWKRAVDAAGYGSIAEPDGRDVPAPLPPPAARTEARREAIGPAPAGALATG